MSFARDQYSATGGQTNFMITYAYLETAHVIVKQNGSTLTEGIGNDYTISGATMTLNSGATADDIIVLTRSTSQTTRLTDYTVPSTLTEADLDNDSLQAFYMAQESIDEANLSIGRDSTGVNWDAETLKILNVVDPTTDQMAATKKYVDDTVVTGGNVPTPDNPGEDTYVLRAASGAFDWASPATIAGEIGAIIPDLVTLGAVSADSEMLVGTAAGVFAYESGATLRTSIGVAIGSNVQAWDAQLDDIAALAPTAGNILIGDGTNWILHPDYSGENVLVNGCMRVAQDGVSFTAATTPANSDDTYLLDELILLSDGNDIVDVSQETSVVPTGSFAAVKADVQTINKKFGFLKLVEARDAARLIGGTASLSFKARTTTGAVIENIRAAVLSWNSTADAVTSDVVSAWNVEGTTPTFAANWTAENTPSNIVVTADAYATHKIENISIDTASAVNLAVFIWVDDTDAGANDLLYIADIKLEPGAVTTSFSPRPYAEELALCLRYFETIRGSTTQKHMLGQCVSTTQAVTLVEYVEKRITPALTISAAGDFKVLDKDGSGVDVTVLAQNSASPTRGQLLVTVASGLVAGNATILQDDAVGASTFNIDARL